MHRKDFSDECPASPVTATKWDVYRVQQGNIAGALLHVTSWYCNEAAIAARFQNNLGDLADSDYRVIERGGSRTSLWQLKSEQRTSRLA